MFRIVLSVTISLFLTIFGTVLRNVSGIPLAGFNIGAFILLPGCLLRIFFLSAWIPIHSDSKFDYLFSFIFYFLLIFLVMKIVAFARKKRLKPRVD